MNIQLASDDEAKLLLDKLVAFNDSKVLCTQKESISKNYVVKSGDNIIAGINACIYGWDILYIDILFVEENHRGEGLGRMLLQKVEIEAKSLGVGLVHLDTFDFQAKDFYIKHGYEVFGVLDDCPKGHQKFYMKKVL